ncbi:hypothetical protein ABT009_29090 [Streptomyces sp. NPDC002896]|uniref:hypothetical protein n=1 Tax=Streptomyces sp. NPDC002896 TaxID=3154438 RepID=UPI00333416BD
MTAFTLRHRTRKLRKTFARWLPAHRRPTRRSPGGPDDRMPQTPSRDGPGTPDVWLAGVRLGG